MISWLKKMYQKYSELIRYGIFGVLTTLVDFGVYTLLSRLTPIGDDASNLIGQLAAVVFAFITNKAFVFKDERVKIYDVLKQFVSFAGFRLLSVLINSGLFWLMHTVLNINDYLSKALIAVIVVILNYIFSKLFVFNRKG